MSFNKMSPCPIQECPGAPKQTLKCKGLKALEVPFWKILRSSGRVRPKYCYYKPEDVEEIDEKETILFLHRHYCEASSQPQNREEEIYFMIMAAYIRNKLEHL